MPHARWNETVRSLLLAGLLAGCGGDDARTSDAAAADGESKGSARSEQGGAGEDGGDPLLRRAREGIREGALPQELRAEVLGSSAPEHARARRVLLAMAEPPSSGGEGGGGEADGAEEDAGSRPPPILPPAGGEAAAEAGMPEGRAEEAGQLGRPPSREAKLPEGRAEEAGQFGRPPSRPPKARADVGGLAFKTTKRGATLTIAAPSSLVVGVANQPSSGIVRLVIEAAQAGSAVLHARPSTEGAAVTGVRQGQGTVQITIRLEPGWSLDSVQPFSGGAKVHLLAPP